ncbi:hypothetical protein BCU46_04740 [Enterovibrio norvegicus]|uniref:hypothetical protein n=1 Tax=Enterovibrio norvegicus TaxID=188144 RepID=UPI000C8399A6|nr:hypothetical protein [Enterovibrio norvegicus]PMI40711.1 hypothetical protein BCU46_04740 [Enterovibrio norvegicus]
MTDKLSIQSIQFIAGAVVSGDLLRRRLNHPVSGSTSTAFFSHQETFLARESHIHLHCFALSDKKTAKVKKAEAEHLIQSREAAARRAEIDSLVNGRKSPTQLKQVENQANIASLLRRVSTDEDKAHDTPFDESARYDAAQRGEKTTIESRAVAALCYRQWQNQTKIQIVAQTSSKNAPAPQSGKRVSAALTPRAVKNIIEAGAYTATTEAHGLRTFATFTFNDNARRRVLSGHEDIAAPFTEIRPTEAGYKPVCEVVGAYSPVAFERNMAKPRVNIAGAYSTLPESSDYCGAFCWIDDKPRQYRKAGFTTEAKVINGDGEIAGAFCPLDRAPQLVNADGEIAGDYCPLERRPARLWEVTAIQKTTIGREMSRTLDGMKKMFERGWKYTNDDGEKIDVPATDGEFRYIWVAESPANEQGEPNPHAHLLTNIAVEQQHFSAFCQRIESLWRNGYAHFERIRNKHAASSYIIKAVGYAAKGDNGEQGVIEGNRYGISRSARAPKWEVLATFEADRLSAVISECNRRLEQWKAPKRREIDRQQFIKNQAKKLIAIEKNKAQSNDAIIAMHSARIKAAESAMFSTRKEIQARGVRVSGEGRFCIEFENDSDFSRSLAFLGWAHGARGWTYEAREAESEVFEPLKASSKHAWSNQKIKFENRLADWRSLLAIEPPPDIDYLETERCIAANVEYYQHQWS